MYFTQKWVSIGHLGALLAKTVDGMLVIYGITTISIFKVGYWVSIFFFWGGGEGNHSPSLRYCWYPITHLGEERKRGAVSCLRKQYNTRGQMRKLLTC